MDQKDRILVIGALGQVGQELVETLRLRYGTERVIGSDIRLPENPPELFEAVDVLDTERLLAIVRKYNIRYIYHLAALLSATAEQKIKGGWRLNMQGLFNVLDLAVEGHIDKIFWPSSIAVFGPSTPRVDTPQTTVMDPNTVYGISKLAGERWCDYYHARFGVDVRSIRYPGLIGYKSLPGGGTTDYAVDIFHAALQQGSYTSFLGPDTRLPMMYMPDAIKATIGIMDAEAASVKIRSSYNIASMSFTPAEIGAEIGQHVPGFQLDYAPDHRQAIADSWPQSIVDQDARADWGWQESYDLAKMTADMLLNLKKQ
ncbi:MAG: NAD-dependent epimerase/dehydratase family protein [Salibacteraceae bacterium]